MNISRTIIELGFTVLLAAVALGGTSWGCSAGGDRGPSSHGTSEVRSGIETGREGIQIARDGLALYRQGARATGLQGMKQGIDLVSRAMGQTRCGMDDMMSSGMMGEGCHGHQMMTSMHEAMAEMQEGRSVMADDDPANDKMGADKMGQGTAAMERCYDAADQAMSRMDDSQANAQSCTM